MTDQQKEESTPTPYKGQYRKEVYKDDQPKNADEIEDPVQQTATPKNLMGSEKEVNYKKRYDDLKRHYDHKLNEWRTKEQTLMAEKKLGNTKLPKTPEELEQFKTSYPDVYAVVETVAHQKVEEQSTSSGVGNGENTVKPASALATHGPVYTLALRVST